MRIRVRCFSYSFSPSHVISVIAKIEEVGINGKTGGKKHLSPGSEFRDEEITSEAGKAVN